VLRRPVRVGDGTETLVGVATLIVLMLSTTGLLLAAQLMIRSP
jgi:hypothetical protein